MITFKTSGKPIPARDEIFLFQRRGAMTLKQLLESGVKVIAALVSGGLDSTVIVHWLAKMGFQVIAVTANLGQYDEKNIDDVPGRMLAASACKALLVDGRPLLGDICIKVMQAMGHYEGFPWPYWQATPKGRYATIRSALPILQEMGIKHVVHGSTGRGNDQLRFYNMAYLDPEMMVIAPWHEEAFEKELGGRLQMLEYCEKHGLEVSATLEQPCSRDCNFSGITAEGGKVEYLYNDPTQYIEPLMGVYPWDAPDKKERLTINFDQGLPVKVNGEELDPVALIMRLNEIAGRNGIGIGAADVVENRVIGIKSHGSYEEPGCSALGVAYNRMLQVIINRKQRQKFDAMSRCFADELYEGNWPTADMANLRAYFSGVAQYVSGSVSYDLYKGSMYPVNTDGGLHCLYCPERSSMEKVGELQNQWARNYLEIHGVSARALAHAGQVKP